MKILLVEDDPIFTEQLSTDLTRQNYLVEAVPDAELAWDYAQSTIYDLFVIDVQLPGSDGISLCRKLRQANHDSAILLLTANRNNADKIKGLDAGADDYVTKPCTAEEIGARIRALLRRPRDHLLTVLQYGDLRLDPNTCEVSYLEQEITLSPKEYNLLELFLRYPQRVFSSEVLLERLWGFEETPGEETIRTHIKRLRRKLKKAGASQVIENIYGMGYRLNATLVADNRTSTDSASNSTAPKTEINTTPQTTPTALQATARNAAMGLMEKFRPEFLDRLAKLDQFVQSVARGDHSEQLQQQAQHAAHKLIGSLGMFGLIEGSQLCQDIEAILKAPQGEATNIAQPSLQELVRQLHQQLDPMLTAPASTSPVPMPKARAADVSSGENPLKINLITNSPSDFTELQTLTPLTFIQSAQARHQISELTSDLAILDMAAFREPSQGCSLLAELVNQFPDLPIIVLVEIDDFQLRLEVIRCSKICMCVSRTLLAAELLDCMNTLYREYLNAKLHILAVDDDPVVSEALKNQLTAEGFKVTTLNEPQQLWESLTLTHPDLLLLDFEMPEVNGIELCRIVRADINWRHLPILFLSGQQDPEIVQKIFHAGADDYIAKPVTQAKLLTRILSRIRRSRQIAN